MLKTRYEAVEYANGGETFAFDSWNRGRFQYTNGDLLVSFVANYSDEVEPMEMLRDLIFMEDVKVFCKKTDKWIYKDHWE